MDTCAAEFPAETPYFYSTYEEEDEALPPGKKKRVIVLGGGPNRIGQGIEFDYCCVHAAWALKEAGYEMEEVPTSPHPDKERRFERAFPNELWQTDIFTFTLTPASTGTPMSR